MGIRRFRILFLLLICFILSPVLYISLLTCRCRKEAKVDSLCPTQSRDSLCSSQRDNNAKDNLQENRRTSRHRYLLVIVIITGQDRREERRVMRNTWLANFDKTKVAVKFVIGTVGLNDEDVRSLEQENNMHDDLLLLRHFREDFAMLSRKVLISLSWVVENLDFDYLFKADDDTYARLPLLLDELDKRQNPGRFYWGFFDGRSSVKRAGKWKESDWILCDKYLPYALGGGYILSHDLVKFIGLNKDYFKMFKNEDVSVGAWLAGIDMERQHDRRFDTEYKSRGCHNSFIVTHKQTVQDMKAKHQSLEQTGKLCPKEMMVRPSYEYNWNVLPSQCCQRNLRLP
ncbi:beta-1,3-galactosyltransferase 6-like [Corticium candelabrum]|uniref:beta-1,3-galactosyltransferase 6-like n=1 Tax=Corticium candelabrum TaxID=121492 RepID=UPI002E26CA19|nr:beta-1,3-galactosyltransferase 6-like [Corticium candelabrum]